MRERDAVPHLDHAGPTNRPRDPEHLRPGRVRRAQRGEGGAAARDDRRNRAERLDVVDDGRLAPQPGFDGKWRPRARLGAAAFDRLEQRRLFAQHESTGTPADLDLAAEVATEHPWPDETGGARLGDRPPEPSGREVGLAVYIKDDPARPG